MVSYIPYIRKSYSKKAEGFYSAEYFNKTKKILEDLPPKMVVMQVFQRQHSVLCGVQEAARFILDATDNGVDVRGLRDGDEISPFESVMTITGELHKFAHLESVYLGVLARATRVATNTNAVVHAAQGRPVIFMADRFDRYENQIADGYAASIGGATSLVTQAMANGAKVYSDPVGTMPHALIAAFNGDVVAACQAYLNKFPEDNLTALVDFNNDCVVDSLRCLKAFGDKLHAVRLDTSGNMVDKSLAFAVFNDSSIPVNTSLTGVNPHLVRLVRTALDENGGKHVKIIVSGGFTPEKITSFVNDGVPVDAFGVGSSLIKNGPDFTADVVYPIAKQGRRLNPNPRLKEFR